MKNKGFTLIELLVAITIMGIIVLMALPSVRRVQLDNKEQKYVAYEKTLKTASKLFVDSYDEDLFGYTNTGCAKVSYEELVAKGLIEPIQLKGITCKNVGTSEANIKTFVYVMKDKQNNYHYFSNVECRDESGKVVYKNNEDSGRSTCGLEDGIGPIVTIKNTNPISDYIDEPYNNGKAGNTAKYPNMELEIKDVNKSGYQAVGLRPGHQSLKYQWFKNGATMTGTNASGSLIIKIKDYYAATGKADIPVPTADMAKAEPDARYSLKVYGTITDMDNNKTTMNLNNTTWVPGDYPPSSAGYEVEKQSKCPTITWTQKNSKKASTSSWYNNDLNQISMKITPINSIIARFKAHHYLVKRNIKAKDTDSDAMVNVNTNLTASVAKIYKIENTVNGKLKYNVSYYKKAGSTGKNYTCSNTSVYKFDHIKPKITYDISGDKGRATTSVKDHKNHKGYKSEAKLKIKCAKNDTLSEVDLYYESKKKSKNPFSVTEDGSHGSYKKEGKCVDEAGNEVAETKEFFLIKYGKNDYKHCGCNTCAACSKSACLRRNSCRDSSHGWESCDSAHPVIKSTTNCSSGQWCCGDQAHATNCYCRNYVEKVSVHCSCAVHARDCDACGCEDAKSCWY